MAKPNTSLETLQQTLILSRFGGDNGYERYYDKRKHFEKGSCPFCPENGFDPKKNEVIYRNNHFAVWVVPRSHNRKSDTLDLYALIVPHGHITSMCGQRPAVWVSLGDAHDWVFKKYKVPGGMFGARIKNVAYSAATEEHLHFFIKVPNLEGLEKKDVREPIAKTIGAVEENLLRGERFSKLYELGVTPEEFKKYVGAGTLSKDGWQASQL